jgi:hypothetical protein
VLLGQRPCTRSCPGACTVDFCNGPAGHGVMKADWRRVVKDCRRKRRLRSDREPSRLAAATRARRRQKIQHPNPFPSAASRDGSRSGASVPGAGATGVAQAAGAGVLNRRGRVGNQAGAVWNQDGAAIVAPRNTSSDIKRAWPGVLIWVGTVAFMIYEAPTLRVFRSQRKEESEARGGEGASCYCRHATQTPDGRPGSQPSGCRSVK